MGRTIKKSELKNVVKQDIEQIFVVIPEFGNEKNHKEKKAQKESRLFKKQKKKISINKVKSNLDTKIYNNRFVMR